MTFASFAALEVVILTTSSAANEENIIKMTFSFQCSSMRFIVFIYVSIYVYISSWVRLKSLRIFLEVF